MAVAPVSDETGGALAAELEAFGRAARGVDVAAVSAGETRVLLGITACKYEGMKEREKNRLQVQIKSRKTTTSVSSFSHHATPRRCFTSYQQTLAEWCLLV